MKHRRAAREGDNLMTDVDRVLVVGGGIAGLTLATALHRRGFEVNLVERAEEWQAAGAGLSVQANGMRILRRLGLDQAVIDAGCIFRRWVFADQDGEALCEIDLDRVWGDVGPCVGIARSRLQQVLVKGAAAVPTRLATTVTSLDDDARQVSVGFTDGTQETYDLVVGADGIRSVVRDLAFARVDPTFAGQIAWRSISPVALPGSPSVQFWLGDGCFFGLCSIDEGHTYGFGYLIHDRHRDPVDGRLERLRHRFGGFGPTVRDYLARLETDEQVHCSTIEWVEQERWHAGRVVLIGDAAHASSPMMGQGGAMAMEDAWVLAEELQGHGTLEQALTAYVERRAPRVHWVQRQSRAVADSFELPPHLLHRALRDRGRAMFHDRYAPLVADP